MWMVHDGKPKIVGTIPAHSFFTAIAKNDLVIQISKPLNGVTGFIANLSGEDPCAAMKQDERNEANFDVKTAQEVRKKFKKSCKMQEDQDRVNFFQLSTTMSLW